MCKSFLGDETLHLWESVHFWYQNPFLDLNANNSCFILKDMDCCHSLFGGGKTDPEEEYKTTTEIATSSTTETQPSTTIQSTVLN